jgi:hypothetical protein
MYSLEPILEALGLMMDTVKVTLVRRYLCYLAHLGHQHDMYFAIILCVLH